MQLANYQAKLTLPDGSDAPAMSSLSYYSTGNDGTHGEQGSFTLRPGVFGLALSTTLTAGSDYQVQANSQSSSDAFLTTFGLRVNDAGAPTFYSDEFMTSALVPQSGVNVFPLNGPNLRGALKTSSGASLPLAEGMNGIVAVLKADSYGNPSQNEVAQRRSLAADGTFATRLENITAGKYFPKMFIAGSLTIPTFIGAPFWVNDAGNYSSTEFGTFVSPASFNLSVRVPSETPNLVIKTVIPGTTTPDETSLWIFDQEIGDDWGAGIAQSAGAAFLLRDGVYDLSVQSTDLSRQSKGYSVNVVDGVASISDRFGSPILPVGGVFTLRVSAPNFFVKAMTPNGAAVLAEASGQAFDSTTKGKGRFVGGSWSNSGDLKFELPVGTFRLVVRPNGSNDYSPKEYKVVNSGSAFAVTELDGTAPIASTEGVFRLPVYANNVFFVIDNPKLPGVQGVVDVNVQVLEIDSLGNMNSIKSGWTLEDGLVGFKLSDGSYQVWLDTFGGSNELSNAKYQVRVQNSVATVETLDGTAVPISNSRAVLAMTIPNLNLKLVSPDNPASILESADVTVWKVPQPGGKTFETSASPNKGLLSLNLGDGEYLIVVNPQGASLLVSKIYRVTVSGSGTVISITDSSNPPISVRAIDGKFNLTASNANVTGRVRTSAGQAISSGSGQYVSINLQKLNVNGSWDWTEWANTQGDGTFGVSVSSVGKYRLRIEPQDIPNSSLTYSEVFEVTSENVSNFSRNFGDIPLVAPNVKLKVRTATGTSDLTAVGIEIRKDGRWVDWANTSSGAVAGLYLTEAGNYELVVNPPSGSVSAAKKRYILHVAENSPGVFTSSIEGLTKDSSSAYVLRLSTPTLAGRVTSPDGLTAVPWTTVVPVNLSTGWEDWEQSVQTDQNGRWTMTLPAGEYKLYAQAPWQSLAYGQGDQSGTVSVNADGVATALPSGKSTTSFDIRLNTPTWSGVVKQPTGDGVIPNAQICLGLSKTVGGGSCTQADSSGRWAISKPTNFTAFDDESRLTISDPQGKNFAENRITGAADVTAALGAFSLGNTYQNIVLRVLTPNTQVLVLAGSAPVPDVWVNLERDGFGWLGGALTNSEGIAKLNIPNPGEGYAAQAYVNGLKDYTNTRKLFTSSDLVQTNGAYRSTLALAVPNFKATVREPGLNGSPIPNDWVSVYNETLGEWSGGVSTDRDGRIAMSLSKPSTGTFIYTVTVERPYFPDGVSNPLANLSPKSYVVVVFPNGSITVNDKVSYASIPAETIVGQSGSFYGLTLAPPTVTGKVVMPDGVTPVKDSSVQVRVPNENRWAGFNGATSRWDGSFGLNLPTGTYDLQADAPWKAMTEVANSPRCEITMLAGSVSNSPGGCIAEDRTVLLKLREPNLTFTLTDGTNPVANANVNVWAGNWSTSGRSDSNGKVSLFIDLAEAALLTPWATVGQVLSLHLNIEPPYGSSSIVRWSCNSGENKLLCTDLPIPVVGEPYLASALDLGDIAFPTPNTSFRVLDPNGSFDSGLGAWVSLLKITTSGPCSGCKFYVGSSYIDEQGYAHFNIDNPTEDGVTWTVEIWPHSRNLGADYSKNVISGLTYEELNDQAFRVSAPNLKVKVLQANGFKNKWATVTLEKYVDANSLNWAAGVGTNQLGEASFKLDSSSKYRLTLSPGGNAVGAITTCTLTVLDTGDVTTDATDCQAAVGAIANGENSDTITVRLARGNIAGIVTHFDQPVAGATIFASAVGRETVVTVSDLDGNYGLQLEAGVAWTIKAIFVNPGVKWAKLNLPTVTPVGNTAITQNIALVNG